MAVKRNKAERKTVGQKDDEGKDQRIVYNVFMIKRTTNEFQLLNP